MRVKADVIPNRYTDVWFRADKEGEYHYTCTQYCGKSHSDMWGKVKVVSEPEYNRWLNEGPEEWKTMKPEELGKQAASDYGCVTCHSQDGAKNTGPTWKGIWGKTEKFTDGSTAVVDEAYIRESVNFPSKKIVATFENQMPSFEGQVREIQMKGLIAFIKTLK